MLLLTANDIAKSYGTTVLLDSAELHIEHGERIGLVGLNGSGKSSLLRILAGKEDADGGDFAWRTDTRVTYLPQRPELDPADRLLDVAMKGAALGPGGLDRHEQEGMARKQLAELGIEDPLTSVHEASGGMKRKAAIAAALLEQPDLLLLDEPTNHLDIETVQWLERALANYPGALLLVTHDRYFLNTVVDRILEIRKRALYSWPGTFEDYLDGRLEQEGLEARAEDKRKQRLKTELAWLRRSPKARTTKQKARIQRAEALMESDFERPATVTLQVAQGMRPGKQILDLEALDIGFAGHRPLVAGVTLAMTKGWRVGVVGPNGAGKTTLLRTLVGELPALGGQVKLGVNTEALYIDQARTGLNPNASVREAATDTGGDWVHLPDGKLHVASYLERFLFRGDDLRQKVGSLSGGQRFRLLLARRLQRPMNLLVLDEPTNDLDFETLSVLEEALLEYPGCLALVSHDRAFMDRVCTHILHLPGDGSWDLHHGNWSQWQQRVAEEKRAEKKAEKSAEKAASQAGEGREKPEDPGKKRDLNGEPAPKLTYAERLRLDGIEAEIEQAESAVEKAEAVMADPEVTADYARLQPAAAALEQAMAVRDVLYEEWERLEAKQAAWEDASG